ncbi:putative Leucine Rich repeat [Trypanosoma vivax]|uniref:Leucine-rich repeat protein (LRRP) n=1 Tax=Trypanosoma vivax (strain Y486) TaxID=1055687 RepID=G0UBJ6_TRYVY|nr:putative Leucine Rich repeat [Trypanosoma vivax]CCC53192.1 conserved hypothetical protein [Trypanosoma vivax Y486]
MVQDSLQPQDMFISPSTESKEAGDEGIRAAIDAARLARALGGATIRPHVRSNPSINPRHIPLALPPAKWAASSTSERALLDLLSHVSGEDATAVVQHRLQVPIALLGDAELEVLRVVLPYMHHVKPHPVMNYNDVRKLGLFISLHGAEVTCLNLGDGAVAPSKNAETPPDALVAKIDELKQRFPLPLPPPKETQSDMDNDEMEDKETEGSADPSLNEELVAWCQSQQVEYTNYDDAIRLRAAYELDVFRNVCELLRKDKKLRVVLLGKNQLAAPDEAERVSLIPLRMLAKVIDVNETIKVLDLSGNALGQHGFGIIGKALTKNISIVALDLSDNQLSAPPPDLDEDPEYQPDDPVFGEEYSGLEAISEVLKKNKFLRYLKLSHNNIHSGDGEEAPPVDFSEMRPEEDAATPDIDGWQDLPLWHLVGPLRQYHRLRALDLSSNTLGPAGARMVATALAENQSVEILDLTDNGIGFLGLHYIAKLLLQSSVSALHTLILKRNQLCGKKTSKSQQKMALAAMEAFAVAVKDHSRLRRLSIAGNHLGPTLSSSLLQTIATIPLLEELDLESNDLCGDAASPHDTTALNYIAATLYSSVLSGRRPMLRVINLGNNNIRSSGMEVLFPAPASMPVSLADVDLSRNNIGNAVGPINHLLTSSPVLSRLVLAYNGITDATVLLPGIKDNAELAQLDLSHNLLGSRKQQYCKDIRNQICGLERLLETLIKHPSLQSVDLSYNDFEDVHGPLLATLCADNGKAQPLRRLDLSGNPEINQCDIEAMVTALENKPGMEAFYISTSYPKTLAKNGVLLGVGRDAALDANMVDDDMKQLLKAMKRTVLKNPTLLDLDCGLQQVTCADIDADTTFDEVVEELRQRLLLNALLALRRQEKSS